MGNEAESGTATQREGEESPRCEMDGSILSVDSNDSGFEDAKAGGLITFRGKLSTGRRTGRSLPEAWETGSPGEESPNSAGQCAG